MRYATFMVLAAAFLVGAQEDVPPLRLEKTIPLPGVKGTLDHLAVDAERKRVFVAAEAQGTIEVIDFETGRHATTIPDCMEPKGVQVVRELGWLVVGSKKDGKVRAFDLGSLAPVRHVALGAAVDNLRFDAAGQRLYVGHARDALAILDPKRGAVVGHVEIEAPACAFELEKKGTRIFANMPKTGSIAVVDRRASDAPKYWSLGGHSDAHALALDEAGRRLFTAPRTGQLLVLDTDTGKTVATVQIPKGADDMSFDAVRKRIYISCGEGYVSVVDQLDPNTYRATAKIPTARGAKTSTFSPAVGRFFVAVPEQAGRPAEVRVFRATGRP